MQLDMWTTVSCLNVKTLPDIIEFAKKRNIPHDWAFLNSPNALNIRYKNKFTEEAKYVSPKEIAVDEDNSELLELFMKAQDRLRGIDYNDYFNFRPNISRNS